jgi:hypothetical protein
LACTPHAQQSGFVLHARVTELHIDQAPPPVEKYRFMRDLLDTNEVAGWQVANPQNIGLFDVIENAQPTVLIGVSGQPGMSYQGTPAHDPPGKAAMQPYGSSCSRDTVQRLMALFVLFFADSAFAGPRLCGMRLLGTKGD